MTDASAHLPLAKPAAVFRFRSYLANFVKGGFAWGFFKDMAIFTAAIIILIEAIFLARAYRTTLPRFGFAAPRFALGA